MNANDASCGPAASLWMKSDIVLKACVVSVVWLQSHAFQEVSSQEIFLFKPSAIHEPHFWNKPTKLSQPHSFNKTPTTVCPESNSLHSSNGFLHDASTQQALRIITQQDNSSLSLLKKATQTLLNLCLLYWAWFQSSELQPTSLLLPAINKAWCCSREWLFPRNSWVFVSRT